MGLKGSPEQIEAGNHLMERVSDYRKKKAREELKLGIKKDNVL